MRTQQETGAKSIHTTNRPEAAVMAPQQIEIDTIGGQWLVAGYYECQAQSRTASRPAGVVVSTTLLDL